jgi:hypothetical protein
MVLLDVGIPPEYVQVIRSNTGPESVEKCRDVQNERIWANFKKKAKGISLGPFFKTPLYFLETENSIFKALFKHCTLHRLENVQTIFLYILINKKYSSYDRVSKSQSIWPFIK